MGGRKNTARGSGQTGTELDAQPAREALKQKGQKSRIWREVSENAAIIERAIGPPGKYGEADSIREWGKLQTSGKKSTVRTGSLEKPQT